MTDIQSANRTGYDAPTKKFATTACTSTQIARYEACGPGRMTVIADDTEFGCEFRFTISGRTNTLTLSDAEAVELAEAILARQGRR